VTTTNKQTPSEARQLARLGLLFLCGQSPRSAIMARQKLATVFGIDLPESLFREVQLEILAEAVSGMGEIAKARQS
jgi:hypothetical protein